MVETPKTTKTRTRQAKAAAQGAGNEGSPRLPITPDGRYFVVRGRLWRCSAPHLPAQERDRLVHELMRARREKGTAMRAGDPAAKEAARLEVDRVKIALGERGPVWWTDGAPDWNRHMAAHTPYAAWFRETCKAV